MGTKRTSTDTILLLGILAAALLLRVVGIDWGLPNRLHEYSYHPDEWQIVENALRMNLRGELNPHFFNYPTLPIYTAAALFRVLAPDSLSFALLLGRLLTALAALLTVLAVARLGARLESPRTGLLAAGLLAVFPLHVVNSHYATVDVPLALWATLALWAAVVLADGPERPWPPLLAGALAVGLATATKYNGLLALLPLWVGLGVGYGRRGWGPGLAALGVALVTFALTSPYVLLDPAAGPALRFELFEHPGQTNLFADAGPGWWLHLRWNLPTATGTFVALAALLGLIGWARRNRAAWPLLAWVLVVGASLLHTHELFIRYWVPLLPVLALAAASALRPLASRRGWLVLALVLVVGGPLLRSRAYAAMMARPDARDVAAEWCFANLAPGTTVGVEGVQWFASVPLQPNNGGARTGSAAAPCAYRLATDPAAWAATPPAWLVVNRTALEPRATSPSWAAGYDLVESFVNHADVLPGWTETGRGSLLHDWNYPLPVIEIWRLRSP